MWEFIKSILYPSDKDRQFVESLKKLSEEYDVHISPRGCLSKTSKPEFVDKHRQELADAFPEIREEIKNKGYCKIKG